MPVWTIVVAAGSGSRFGRAKQYEALGDKRVLDWALAAARAVSEGVVLVVPPESAGRREPGVDAVVPGGATRSGSVRAGLAAVPGDADVILVHDAARPLAPIALFEAVIAAVRAGADCAIPAVAVSNTVKRVAGIHVVETVDRTDLVEVQTPQGFAAAALRSAHGPEPDATDDAALVEAAGGSVVVVPGDPTNLKLTHPHDLVVARALLAGDHVIRVGMGFDVHPFSDDPERRLVLGGVELAGERGLVGHSDSDVIAHAVSDALLGAAGLGDLGGLFPASDPTWKDADSIELLRTVRDRVGAAGWSVVNVDTAVVLEAPKLAPHTAAMEARLRDAAGGDVSVKPKRAEGLGSLGRGEGIACWAVALLESSS